MKVLILFQMFLCMLLFLKVSCDFANQNLQVLKETKAVIQNNSRNYKKRPEEIFKKCMFKQTCKNLEKLVTKLIEKGNKKIYNSLNNVENNSVKNSANYQNSVFAKNDMILVRKVRQAFNRNENSNAWSKCVLQSEMDEHKFLEKQHILSISQEMEKLKELVRLLRDQQYVLNMLTEFDNKPQFKTEDKEDQKQLMELLRQLMQNLPSKTESKSLPEPQIPKISEIKIPTPTEKTQINPNNDNLSSLAIEIKQLKELMDNKNVQEADKQNNEAKLIMELKNHQKKLQEIQNRLDNLRKDSVTAHLDQTIQNPKMRIVHPEDDLDTVQKELRDLDNKISQLVQNTTSGREISLNILGLPLEKKHPALFSRKATNDLDELLSQFSTPKQSTKDLHKTNNQKTMAERAKPRADGDEMFETLQRLLDGANPNPELKENPFDFNPNSQMQNRLQDLEKQLKISAKIGKLEKKIKQLQDSDAEIKSTDEEDEIKNQLKKMQQQLNKLNKSKAQSKDLDDEESLLDELKGLQSAINNLKPKEDDSSLETTQAKDGVADFQILLNKFLNKQVTFPSVPAQIVPPLIPAQISHHLSPAQVQILKRKMMQMKYGGKNQYGSLPSHGQYGYGNSMYGYGNEDIYGADNVEYGNSGDLYGSDPYGNGLSYGEGGGSYPYSSSGGQYGAGYGQYGTGYGQYGSGFGNNGQYGSAGSGYGQYGSSYGQHSSGKSGYGYGKGSPNKYSGYGASSGKYNMLNSLYNALSGSYGSSSAKYSPIYAQYGTASGQYGHDNLNGYYLPSAGSYGYTGKPYGQAPYGTTSALYAPYGLYGPGGIQYGNRGGQYGSSGGQYGANSGQYGTNGGEQYGSNNKQYGSIDGQYGPSKQTHYYGANKGQYGQEEASGYGYGTEGGLSPYSINSGYQASGSKPYDIKTNSHSIYEAPYNPYSSSKNTYAKPHYDSSTGANPYKAPINPYQYSNNFTPSQYTHTQQAGNTEQHAYTEGYKPISKPYINVHSVFEHLAHGHQEQPHFFPGYQESGYQNNNPDNYKSATNTEGSGTVQSYVAPQQNTIVSDSYAQQKVGDLKTQIYNLENVINNLNRPEDVQKPGDQNTIYKLEKQIGDLKHVVNDLSEDVPNPNSKHLYGPNSPNINQNADYQPPSPGYQTRTGPNQAYDLHDNPELLFGDDDTERSEKSIDQDHIETTRRARETNKEMAQQFEPLLNNLNETTNNISETNNMDLDENTTENSIENEMRYRRETPHNIKDPGAASNNAMHNFFQHLNDIWEIVTYYAQKGAFDSSDCATNKTDQKGLPDRQRKKREFINDENLRRKASNVVDEVSGYLGGLLNTIGEFSQLSGKTATYKEEIQTNSATVSDNKSETHATNRKARRVSESDNLTFNVFEQLKNLITTVDNLAHSILQNNCNCSHLHKQHFKSTKNSSENQEVQNEIPQKQDLFSLLMRRKRQAEESEEDNDMESAFTKMLTIVKDLAEKRNNRASDSAEEQEEIPKSNRELQSNNDPQILRQRLDGLKKQLETKLHTNMNQRSPLFNQKPPLYNQKPLLYNQEKSAKEPIFRSFFEQPVYNQGGYYQQPAYYPQTYYDYEEDKPKKLKIKKKKSKDDVFDKIFEKIVNKIINKVMDAIPIIIRRLLSLGLEDLFSFGIDYGYEKDGYDNYGQNGYDKNGYAVKKDYKKFGLFSFLPMLVLKLFSNLNSFIKKLQKNRFLRTFLVPGFVIVATAGLVVFLVWWLSNDDQYYYNGYDKGGYNDYNNYGYSNNNYGQSNNNYKYSNNYGNGYRSNINNDEHKNANLNTYSSTINNGNYKNPYSHNNQENNYFKNSNARNAFNNGNRNRGFSKNVNPNVHLYNNFKSTARNIFYR